VNLFRHKLAIFIILSWVMLIAALVGYTLGIWWTSVVVFFPFMFFRFALPGAGRKLMDYEKSADCDEVNEWGTSKKPTFKIESLLGQLGFMAIYLLIINSDLLGVMNEFLWRQRQNPLMVVGIGLYVLKLVAVDLRYFSNVPESDLKVFLRD
jgi:hypothetical protein